MEEPSSSAATDMLGECVFLIQRKKVKTIQMATYNHKGNGNSRKN